MPNLALVPALKQHFDKILYMGGAGMEQTLVPQAGLPFFQVDSIRFHRANPFKNLKIPFVLQKGAAEAGKILDANHVSVVFSKGGYAALPACLAAKKRGIPVVLHESDYTLGLANRYTARFAAKSLTSFPETKGGVCTGNPIRPALFEGSAVRARETYRINAHPVLLVFGGSLGAAAVNRAVLDALPRLTARFHVVHVAGKGGEAAKPSARYTPLAYAADIGDLYALADAVVMRGGANSLAEAAALGKRTLCIPLPKGNSRGDQPDNAESYKKRGKIDVLPQSDLCADTLCRALEKLMQKPAPAPEPNRAESKIVKEIVEVLQNNEKL